MFDVGFGELVLVGVIALLVLGPERLPQAARTAGLWAGRLRATVQRFTADVDRELKAEELRQTLREEARRLAEPVEALHKDIAAAGTGLAAVASVQGDASAPTQSPEPNKTGAASDGS